jgi:hypothetical protein
MNVTWRCLVSHLRAHVVIPTELVKAIDHTVGSRRRSQFIVAAAEKELLRIRQIEAVRKYRGAWSKEKHSELMGSGGSWGYVRKIRKASDKRLKSS